MALDGLLYFIIAFVVIRIVWLAWQISYIPGRRKDYDSLPGAPRVPILGHMGQVFRFDRSEFYRVMQEYMMRYNHDGLCIVQFLSYPIVFVFEPKMTEIVLASSRHMEKADVYKMLHPWLGEGLLTSSGNKWHSRRRLLTPSFHFQILKDFIPIFNEQAEILCKKLKTKADGKTSFDICPLSTLCTLDIICETAMGEKMNAQDDGSSEYVWAVKRMSEILMTKFQSVWYWNETLFNLTPLGREQVLCLKILHDTTRKVIIERAKVLEDIHTEKTESRSDENANVYFGKRKRLAFLDTLLLAENNGTKLSFSDIREEVDTFMFEGHDTTTTAVNYTIYFMGLYSEVQKKVYQEMVDIFGDRNNDPVTCDDLSKMTYLECVIKETLRLYPSVAGMSRTLSRDEMFGNHLVPKGTTLQISNYRLHRNPEYYPDPERFDPDRFTPENSMKRDPYAYIPFSAGLRNCIGRKFAMMELKVILSTIVRKFKIKSLVPREKLVVVMELVLRPRNGIEVILTSRT